MELIVGQTHAFPAFSKAKTYTTSFDAHATATDAPTLLSLADGDATQRLQARPHLRRRQAAGGAAGGDGRQRRHSSHWTSRSRRC